LRGPPNYIDLDVLSSDIIARLASVKARRQTRHAAIDCGRMGTPMKSRQEIEELLDGSIGFMLNVTSRRTRRMLQLRLTRAGLDYGAWYFLRVLWVEEGVTQKQLCERTELSQATAAAALKRMAAKGLAAIRPDPHDRRSSRVFLTKKARDLQPHFAKLIQEAHDIAVAGLSSDELAELRRILRKVRANCDAAHPEANDAEKTPTKSGGSARTISLAAARQKSSPSSAPRRSQARAHRGEI
jgi:MarR family transcriptional regulator, organic hydroperoxide resistance regulator